MPSIMGTQHRCCHLLSIKKNILDVEGDNQAFVFLVRHLCGEFTSSTWGWEAYDFWFDCWAGNFPLAYLFPRIFELAVKKKGKVSEFGVNEQDGWKWLIYLRRQLFDWENAVWDQFISTLNICSASSIPLDSLCWIGDSSGCYNSKKYSDIVSSVDKSKEAIWSLVWDNCIPPKIQFFVWRLLRGRIATKVNLRSRGSSVISDLHCPLCGLEDEIEYHLFFSCRVSWRCWMKWCSKWSMSFVLPGSAKSVFSAWCESPINKLSRPIWFISFFSFCWSIWLCRNEIIFNNKCLYEEQLFEGAQIRTFHWCRNNWPETFISESYFLANPARVNCTDSVSKKITTNKFISIEAEFFFYVDGAIKGSFGEVGIGGSLRDTNGKQLAKFSKSVGVIDATSAELLAIKEACSICKSKSNLSDRKVLFVSDSTLAISWVLKPHEVPMAFKPIIDDILNWSLFNNWSFENVSRDCNEEADALAKNGIGRVKDLVWFDAG